LIVVAALLLFTIVVIAFGAHEITESARHVSAAFNTRATLNERAASQRVGGFDNDTQRLYHQGVQHIVNKHQRVGSFTIGQVIDQERGREQQRSEAAARQQERARQIAADNEQRRKDAAQAAIAAEDAHFMHGTPDCLVLDNRTVHAESGEYSWYIDGKVTNRCDRELGYVQVEIGFFDSAGNLQNSGLANVNNLEAGQTWSIHKLAYESEGAGTWRIEKLSGF